MTVLELKAEVSMIKTRLHQIEMALEQRKSTNPTQAAETDQFASDDDIIAWMRDQGLIVDPPFEALPHAERWQDMADQEKQAILWELDHLPPGPMVSDIIIQTRR